MRRLLRGFHSIIASRAVTPIILGCFALIYIIIAFYTDETLVALMALVRSNSPLILLLSCIPVNLLAILCRETAQFSDRRHAVRLSAKGLPVGTYQERVFLGTVQTGLLEKKIEQSGYHYRIKGDSCAAWKGISIFPARFLFLMGSFCLFAGILVSLTTKVSLRDVVIEGEPLPEAVGVRGRVEQITLRQHNGIILSHSLDMDITLGEGDEASVRKFGVYPPGRINGIFFYPRYLGLAPLIEFTPPESGQVFSSYIKLMIYPPGKEDGVQIPRSPYRISFTIIEPMTGAEPYITGKFNLRFKVLKGNDQVSEGTLPLGGTVSRGGYTLSFPDAKKLVAVDFVKDPGLPLLWIAGLLFLGAIVAYIPIRMFAPRREIIFIQRNGSTEVFSRAEGRAAKHRGILHNMLDHLCQSQ
ncbi:ResB-like family cytochrome c biogenesis protein, putative [Geotalea daltonii FRC-32]|uniref:ResB-like family cytochrome c biogenesis protein, putative n=1 Tax=Geotalea daltonii (strain DSM 22248 / JCM 15807 / FRC-32) TaxID=316067 RepID=B9M7Y4_GEODF|nr:hypothetical protein [Geotalea daltonii]ACM18442.1 ResB-like family cytochrome c biogenesis protein, putative [Geotalea daltonii FRC-32]